MDFDLMLPFIYLLGIDLKADFNVVHPHLWVAYDIYA